MEKFIAELKKLPDMNAAYVSIPDEVHKKLGGKKRIKIFATIDGEVYRGSILDMGLGMMLMVTQEIRKKISKNPGDEVIVTIRADKEERKVEIPPDLSGLLKRNPEAEKFFNSLSYTNRKEFARWITDAKRVETRQDRLQKTVQLLLLGRKNPTDKG